MGESARSAGLDEDHVRVLAGVAGPLPPISVHHETMRIIDGAHRWAAARLNGRAEIEVRFFHGSAEEAFRLGVLANVAHGLPLTLKDRRAAATRIMRTHPLLSDRAIAQTAGLSPRTVAAMRSCSPLPEAAAAVTRIGADGRTRPLSAASGRLAAGAVIARRPDASLREIAREAGISVGTARDVRKRVQEGRDLVPPQSQASQNAALARRVAPPEPVDVEGALSRLRRDPALRYSDSGRTLLKWLDARALAVQQWPVSAGDVPAHCQAAIAQVARECARAWTALADELAAG